IISFFHCTSHHRDLHSFPTRRSSDLTMRTAVRCPPAVFMRARFVTCSMSFNDTRMPETSIIIRTYNEEKHLPELIEVSGIRVSRSEEHTSELQSRENLVCRLLLEKKK